jgi:DHA1 family bicyclomycin/chloramphenicol resistance-like MFS transporter
MSAPADTAVAPPSPLLFATLVAAVAVGHMSQQIFAPAVPAIASEFAVSLGVAQIAFSLSLVAMAVAMLVYGPLSDRYGRRPMLGAGLTLMMAGSVIGALAPSIEFLIAGRVIQAAGGACGLVIARAVVRDLYGPQGAARVLGTLIMFAVTAPMIGVVLGGVLTDTLGWRFVFAVMLGLSALTLLLVMLVLPRMAPAASAAPSIGALARGYAQLMRSPVFLGFALQGGLSPGSFTAIMATGPFLIVSVLDRPATEFGVYFALVTVVYMSGNFLGGRLSNHVGIERMVLLAGLLSAAAALAGLAWFALAGLGVAVIFLTSTGTSIGNGLAQPNSQAGAMNVNPQLAGTASGGAAFIQTMLSALFAQVTASLIDDSGAALFIAMAVSAILALGFGAIPYILRRRGA